MGKIMKEGKQYGVGGTQKADEITYGSGTVADALNSLNTRLSTMYIKVYTNTSGMNIGLPEQPTSSSFGTAVLVNSNLGIVQLFELGTTIRNDSIYARTSRTFTATITSGALTITPSDTLWGLTTVFILWNK